MTPSSLGSTCEFSWAISAAISAFRSAMVDRASASSPSVIVSSVRRAASSAAVRPSDVTSSLRSSKVSEPKSASVPASISGMISGVKSITC